MNCAMQMEEASKLDALSSQVDLMQAALSKASSELVAAGGTNTATAQALEAKRCV